MAYLEDNDEIDELVTRAQSGDSAALDQLLARVEPLVKRRVAKFLPYAADAEEAAQDALLLVATRLNSFAGNGSFLGWVTVVASNSARSTYRTLKRRSQEQAAEIVPENLDPRTTSVIAGSRIDLMEALEAMEAKSPQLVQPFVMRDIGSLPYDEIADTLGLPLGTVKAQIHTARAFMRGALAEKLG